MRLGRMLYVVGVLSALAVSAAISPLSALTNADKMKLAEALNKQPPIEFSVAKGAPNACGPGCDRWIAAEGHFDSEAVARLHRILDKLGKPNLPIYFNSSGGNLTQAMEIGRMMRARGMTAGVALTLAAKCRPEKTVDECAKLIRSNPDSEAVIQTDRARCLSACAIAILGAAKREVAPDALLGVHSALVYISHPKGATERQIDNVTARATQILEKRLANYVGEMKLNKELFNIISNTRFETFTT
jgi:hypothetical protein